MEDRSATDESSSRQMPDRVAHEDRPRDVERRHGSELVGALAAGDGIGVGAERLASVDEARQHARRSHGDSQMEEQRDAGGADERVAQHRVDRRPAMPEGEHHHGEGQGKMDEVVGVGRNEDLRPSDGRLRHGLHVEAQRRLEVEQA